LIGRLAMLRWYRLLLLAGWMFAPIIAWSAFLATGEPSPPGYWSWWRVSMVYLAIPFGIWIACALGGYLNAKRGQTSCG
jgi:hypothetical protein